MLTLPFFSALHLSMKQVENKPRTRNLFWRALAGAGSIFTLNKGGRGMGKQLSHACLSKKHTESITFVAAILLMILFGYAATSKLADYSKFVTQMELVPLPTIQSLAPTLAWLVPLIEVLIVVLLVVERWRLKGFWASLFLLLAFQIYILTLLSLSLELPCTCGGLISDLKWNEHLIFNAIFIGITIIAIKLNIRHNEVAIDYKQLT